MRVNIYNVLPLSETFIAKINNKVIGCVSIIPDSSIGLPADIDYRDEINKIRSKKRWIAEISGLAKDTDYCEIEKFIYLKFVLLIIGYAKNIGIDDIVIYASNDQVLQYLTSENKCNFVRRDESLDSQDVSIEAIIESFLAISDADVIVLMHPRSPFIRPETIASCIRKVKSRNYDSAFLVTRAQKFAWFRGKPLNYSYSIDTPHISLVDPVMLESSSIYVFRRETFIETHHRIGKSPYMKEVGHFEGFEIDHLDDFEIAELIVNAGLNYNGV